MKSDFFSDVYDVVRLIPYGKVTSYGAIALYLGVKGGARMVGWALNNSHTLADVPAHRVVNRNGLLTGKHLFETPTQMSELLIAEGVTVINNEKIADFEKYFWNPTIELLK
jgi:methylated-DNA-protein-cysteine methyltransferase-like protein